MTDRSVTHGTCALNAHHTSEEYARECLVLGRTRTERLEAFRRATAEGAAISLQGSPTGSPPARVSPVDSEGISITPQPDQTYRQQHPRGRPRKHPNAAARNREAQRAHRERQREAA